MSAGVAPVDPLAVRVAQIVAKTARIDPARISSESNFSDLGIDSLDANNILFALEDEFNITISDEAARGITSIRQTVENLRPLISQPGPAEPGA